MLMMQYGRSRVLVMFFLAGLQGSCTNPVGESNALYALGNEALASMDLARAVRYYDEAIRLNPDHAEAFLKRGQIRCQSNQFEAALPDLDRAIQLDTTLTWAYFFRGVSRVSLGREQDAVPDFSRVIDRNEFEAEDVARALTWRSIALFKLQRHNESIDDLSSLIEREPDKPIHRIDRGGAYQWIGRTGEAIADYRQALGMEGLDEELRRMLSERLAALGVNVDSTDAADATSSAGD